MDVSVWTWAAVIGGLLLILAFDLWIVDRGEPREFSMRQASIWVGFYVTLAVLFGIGIWVASGADRAGEFFAGYLTEYSLSVDNLFVFYLIMARFAVPKAYQHKVLLIGILIALVMRGFFIAVGAAALANFSWLFYVFGVFLIYTAVNLVRQHDEEDDVQENILLRWARRALPTTPSYVGAKITVKVDGKRMVTPMLIVMIAIGTTDLLFALDSIPAIFGLTQEAFIVFTANAFALMGLRQLYFLIGGLLQRLVYLSYGLAFILGFIGVKLIVEALHSSGVHWAPEVPIWLSLSVIGVTMVTTTVLSLLKSRRDARGEKATPLPAGDGQAEAVPVDGDRPADTDGGDGDGSTVARTRQTSQRRN
ncbi:TerC family protein [Thermostaphylospora chromogena]|uniref:Tellurite resistance protein TerC n=1 Tax=Thermostaphylospora chromogena TaxID=35622 RepID=A0A1H1HMN2_9ACTN|nr:TerC family protein [Thermostaphylospora chromogena]SDR26316.1 tellurite resistance protein TerC [Thermostaphylospora chromogena]